MNRVEMLREMGITPVWVSRHAKPAQSKSEMAMPPESLVDAGFGDVAARNVSGSASQRVPSAKMPTSATAIPRPTAPATVHAAMSTARAAAPRADVATPATRSTTTATVATATTAIMAAAGVDPARAERIGRMDWPALKDAVTSCQACGLCKSRHSTVFGTGDESADLMIIGEAPGQEEDRQGEPFVGQAGHLLDSMLAALDFTRTKNVYIANTLKCRPPGNRNPERLEMAQCAPHLIRQVELLAPKLILLMGRFAVQSMLETDGSIASLRGKRHAWRGVPVVVTYHPAYLLRNLPDKAKAWEDLVFARTVLAEAGGG